MMSVKEQVKMCKENLDTIKLSIPNKPEYVSVVRLTVAAIANRLGFDIEAIEDMKVAIAEACTNAITHGQCEGEANFNIEFNIESEKLTIYVSDYGKGCLEQNIKTPDLENPREGGLGVFIIKSLMDDVEIVSDLGKGTTIKMIKYIGEDY